MWTCPLCDREFTATNQVHSCRDRELSEALAGKAPHTVSLFDHLVDEYLQIGEVKVYPTKSMIALGARVNFAYITQLGKNFIDVVFPFDKVYDDNLCFSKIKQVPGTNQYNHYFRMFFNEDINDEVRKYMKMALDKAS
jgi:hypothetical protein